MGDNPLLVLRVPYAAVARKANRRESRDGRRDKVSRDLEAGRETPEQLLEESEGVEAHVIASSNSGAAAHPRASAGLRPGDGGSLFTLG
jgi:hypothetical protein